MKTQSKRTDSTQSITPATARAIFIASLCVAGIWAIGYLLPYERLWGINHLRYLPIGAAIFFPVLLAVVTIPAMQKRITSLISKVSEAKVIGFAIAILVHLIFFESMETFFYGDGGLLPPLVYKLGLDKHADVSQLLNLKSAPLTGGLIVGLTFAVPAIVHLLNFTFDASTRYPFFWLSIPTLIAYAFAFRFVAKDRTDRLSFLAMVGTAGALFYFGYVEYYTLVFAAIAIYLLAAERFLRGAGSFATVTGCFIVACLAHYFTFALLPSFLFLFSIRSRGDERRVFTTRQIVSISFIVLIVGIIAYFVTGLAFTDNRIVMPVAAITTPAGTQAYTLLSSMHLIDMLNLLLLLSPLAIVFVVFSIVSGKLREFVRTDVFRFHFLAIFFFGCFIFFGNTSLGLARDWDIAAPLGVMISFFALAFLRFKKEETAALHFALVSVVAILPWLTINLNTTRATARFADVMELDAMHLYGDYALSGYEALRKHYEQHGDVDKVIECTKKMIELLDYPMHYDMLLRTSQTRAAKQPEYALSIQRWMLQRLRARQERLFAMKATSDYSISVAKIDSLAEAIAYYAYTNSTTADLRDDLSAMRDQYGNPKTCHAATGLQLYFENKFPEAIGEFRSALATTFESPEVYGLLGSALYEIGDATEAERVFAKALQRFPSDPELRLVISLAYAKRQIKAREVHKLLTEALGMNPSTEMRMKINSLLQAIGIR